MIQCKVVAESCRRLRPGNLSSGVNRGREKNNVTAFPAAMHPIDCKPMKLPKGSAVNLVLALDSEYLKVVDHLQERLVPYPEYRLANYRLATADGALIVEGTPFYEFPFNLAGGGKKSLWLVRMKYSTTSQRSQCEDDADGDSYHDPPSQGEQGISISGLLPSVSTVQPASTSPIVSSAIEAFRDISSVTFDVAECFLVFVCCYPIQSVNKRFEQPSKILY